MNPTLIAAILSAAVPTLAIILGILLNRSDYHKLDSKIDAVYHQLDAKIDTVYHSLKSKIDAVQAQQHADIIRLYELFGGHSQRITRLETQVQGS